MEKEFITITKENIESEHICCAFSDKKCKESYELKKQWLKKELDNDYVFRRLNERAKVFIEYVEAEKAWLPVDAKNYLMINCFWVAGQYKGKGYGVSLLKSAIDDAKKQNKNGLVTVVGTNKLHFMSDTKWLLKQGFEESEKLNYGFSLLTLKIKPNAENPAFKKSVLNGECKNKNGLTAYYTNRCPFTEYYVNDCLSKIAEEKNIPLKIIKLKNMEEARECPTPATIFSLFYNGKFLTNDLSVCTESKFNKIVKL